MRISKKYLKFEEATDKKLKNQASCQTDHSCLFNFFMYNQYKFV